MKTPRVFAGAFGLLALLAGPAAGAAPAPVPTALGSGAVDRGAQAHEVRLREDLNTRFTVPVTVAGTGPYRFLVDTGAERTVISRQLADRLNLPRGPAARVVSVASTTLTETALVPGIGLGQVEADPFQSPLFNADNIGADGMLGIDSLKSQRVVFDFRKRTMTMAPAGRRGAERLDDGTILVRARSRNGRLILTDARANGRKVRAIVDTGSQVTVGNMALRAKLLGRQEAIGETIVMHAASGETIRGELYMIPRLSIGEIEMTDAAIIFADSPVFSNLGLEREPSLLLGMNIMRAFDRVSIDFAARTLRFVLPESSGLSGARFASYRPPARLH